MNIYRLWKKKIEKKREERIDALKTKRESEKLSKTLSVHSTPSMSPNKKCSNISKKKEKIAQFNLNHGLIKTDQLSTNKVLIFARDKCISNILV